MFLIQPKKTCSTKPPAAMLPPTGPYKLQQIQIQPNVTIWSFLSSGLPYDEFVITVPTKHCICAIPVIEQFFFFPSLRLHSDGLIPSD